MFVGEVLLCTRTRHREVAGTRNGCTMSDIPQESSSEEEEDFRTDQQTSASDDITRWLIVELLRVPDIFLMTVQTIFMLLPQPGRSSSRCHQSYRHRR